MNMPENFRASSKVFLPPPRTLPDLIDLLGSSIFCAASLGKIPKGNSEMGIILLDRNSSLLTCYKLTTNVSERKSFSLAHISMLFLALFQRPTAASKAGTYREDEEDLLLIPSKRSFPPKNSNLFGLYAKKRNGMFCAKYFCSRRDYHLIKTKNCHFDQIEPNAEVNYRKRRYIFKAEKR